MADTQIWLGTVSDSFALDANWGGTNGANRPAAADSVIVPLTAANHIKTDVDQSQFSATLGFNLALLYVQEGSTVEIGASGAPLELTADVIIHRGDAPFWFNSATGTDDSFVTDRIEVQSINMIDAMNINSEDPGAGLSAAISRITLLRGKSTISGGTTEVLPRLEMGWVNSPSSDVICVIGSGGAATTLVLMGGGEMVCDSVVTTAVQMGGQWTQDTEEIVTLHMSGRPLMIYNSPTAAGQMTLANLMGGVLDTTRSSDLKTIDDVYIWPGALLLRDADLLAGNEIIIGSGIAATQSPIPVGSGQGASS
jgi:hypothetical protein